MITKKRELIRATSILLLLPFISIFILCFLTWLSSPTKPSRNDITGTYEIDRSHYPGENADWQHANYEIEITDTEIIVKDKHLNITSSNDIEWFTNSKYRWRFKHAFSRHHIIAKGPAIYRQPFSYYYVFNSKKYGNVFFKKKSLF